MFNFHEDIDQAKKRYKPELDAWIHSIRVVDDIDQKIETHHYPRNIKLRMIAEQDEHVRNGWKICQDLGHKLRNDTSSLGEAEQIRMMLYAWAKEQALGKPLNGNGNGNGNGEKWIWVVCGPNGAGKSTFVDSEYVKLVKNMPLVNPDLIALSINPDDPAAAAAEAGRASIERIDEYVEKGKSFIVETTLSGHYHTSLAKRLKEEEGYHVGMVFIGNDSPEISVDRVKIRVGKGGHDVPEVDIRRRWHRSMENAHKLVQFADATYIIDNSTPEGFQLAASGSAGMIYPIRKNVLRHLIDRLDEIGHVKSVSALMEEVSSRNRASAEGAMR